MSSPRPEDGRRGRRRPAARDLVVLLIFGVRLVQTVLRMAMGALVVYICEEYGCTASSKGWILSAHAFGYCTTQVIGGAWADRAGGRGVTGAALAVAGLALAATPLAAAAMGLAGILATQVVMGIAMGPLFPATMQVLAKWLPPSERAFASTALDSGITVGSLVAVPVSSFLAMRFGWGFALVVYGVGAVAYSAAWAKYAAERPEECSFCGLEEQVFLASVLPRDAKKCGEKASDTEGFATGLAHVRFWAIYLAHFAFNYSVYFVNSWSATYYLEAFGLRPENAGLHLSLPHAVNMLVKVFASPVLAQSMKAAGMSDLGSRRAFSGLGFLAPALCLQLLPRASGSVHLTTALFSAMLGFMALHPSGFKANYMDVTRTHGGTVSGIGNTIASVASSVGPLLVSQVRMYTGAWGPVFHSVALVNLLAALVFCTLSSTTPIEDEAPEPAAEPEGQCCKKAQVGRILRLLRRRPLASVVTGTHLLLPIRWVVLVPLEVFSIVLYSACAFILGGPDGVNAWSSLVLYVGLVLISAMGRRAIECHERDEMWLLIQERSLRVATEHRLTRIEEVSQSRLPEDQLSTRESRPETTDSAQEFVKATEEGDLEGVAAIGKREQWMVDFKELKISPGYILGQGAFGKVVAGFYAGSPAAIKLTNAILCDDGGTNLNHSLLASLLNEMRIMRRLHHPNICSFYGASFDLQGSCVALVLEWVHGTSLERFILQRGMSNRPLRVSDQFKAVMDTCSAVRYLHSRQPQIVHGDLKGTNIMIEPNPGQSGSFRAKLLDFGLSRVLTRHARPLSGTAMWVAPEVVLFPGAPAKVCADVFSFGRLSFFVLTGRFPFKTRSTQQILQTIRSGSLPPLPWPTTNFVLSDWRCWIEKCSLQAADRRPCMDDVSLCILSTLDKEDSKVVEAIWGLPIKAIRPLESLGPGFVGTGLSASERPLAGEGPSEAQRVQSL